ncbi:hypothetical protein PAPHI01_1027 [Pancytospora philotis]|nr:hypothetical protein PAPHI01_1027 [Pancytospora philotis]
MLFLLAVFAQLLLADNIEFWKHEFKTIYCFDRIIHSKDMVDCNFVQFAFTGDLRYEVLVPEPGVLLIFDRTRYFGPPKPFTYRVDFARKAFGVATFAWPMIGYCIVLGVCCFKAIACIFSVLDARHAAAGCGADAHAAEHEFSSDCESMVAFNPLVISESSITRNLRKKGSACK